MVVDPAPHRLAPWLVNVHICRTYGDHQQYLSANKNPGGYCGIGGTGLSCPVGVAPAE
ncbi:hypothetical protein SAMN06265355_115108 [Actinomadura mexicana]|uniref:Uncharacterized protein n=1 Tax=Actinomadura mexicana TaxID=134959 RepID=A0A239DS51_9ACTN|nr:hypothetical protein SAMN06265355_115108 [Actinomadura mexicana]